MQSKMLNLASFTIKQAYSHVLKDQTMKDLKSWEKDFNVVFKKNNFKYIFGKKNPIHNKSLIRIVNKDLKNACKLNNK